jgi:hypothetical protein
LNEGEVGTEGPGASLFIDFSLGTHVDEHDWDKENQNAPEAFKAPGASSNFIPARIPQAAGGIHRILPGVLLHPGVFLCKKP